MHFGLRSGFMVLERTPATLRAMLSGLGPEWIEQNEGPETWSPFDVVGHLIHGERTDWVARAEIILAQGENRRFTPFDRTAMFDESKGKRLSQLLDEFESLRKSNLETARSWSLSEQQLDLRGEHPKFGSVSLRQLLATWVAHDLSHIAQIARVMAKQYRDPIGPWREYLPIMDR
ncbi:MAG TPA: DinB family protein [Gemmatimonadaceae bacterium]|nr:DinB family protein [Gemmatimonadaceae bacterium]